MTAPHETSTPDTNQRSRIELNPVQIAAGALAAITAAVLGSHVGVAGTVIGAAVASIISAVASAVYQHSIERSRERLRSGLIRPRTVTGSSRNWRRTALISAAGAFVVAALAVSGYEAISGSSLGGQGRYSFVPAAVAQPAPARHVDQVPTPPSSSESPEQTEPSETPDPTSPTTGAESTTPSPSVEPSEGPQEPTTEPGDGGESAPPRAPTSAPPVDG